MHVCAHVQLLGCTLNVYAVIDYSNFTFRELYMFTLIANDHVCVCVSLSVANHCLHCQRRS